MSCCALATLLGSISFFALGIWAVALHKSLTPVYTDVQCKMQGARPTVVTLAGGGTKIALVSTTVCENPNPYAVEMKSSQASNVYMGQDRDLVTQITDIPLTILPAKGTGSIDVHVVVEPTGALLLDFLGALTNNKIPIYIENNIDLLIDIDFFFSKFKAKHAFTKDCGFLVQVIGAKVGPMVCADEFDELELPPVSDEAFDGQLELYAANLADDEIKAGTTAKDVGLGVAMAFGFGLGVVLLLTSLYFYRHAVCGRARDADAIAGHPEQPEVFQEATEKVDSERPAAAEDAGAFEEGSKQEV